MGVHPFPDPVGNFWALLGAILDFAGGVALQVVSECPWRRQAGIFFFLRRDLFS